MKKIFIALAFVTFSLSLAAAPGDGQLSYELRQLEFSDIQLNTIYGSLQVEVKRLVSLEKFKEIFSNLVPCILSLHNSSGEKASIKRLRRDLFRQLEKVGMRDVYPKSRWIVPIDNVNLGVICVAIGYAIWQLIIAAPDFDVMPFSAAFPVLLAAFDLYFVWVPVDKKLSELKQQHKFFMSNLIQKFQAESVFQLLQDVSKIGAEEIKHCLIFCTREGLEEKLEQLRQILARHGFTPELAEVELEAVVSI